MRTNMNETKQTEKSQEDIIKKIKNLLEKNGCKDITNLRSYLYKITNTKNGKWYIGSTINPPERRFRTHKYNLNKGSHANQKLQASWNVHGQENFKFEVIGEWDNFYQAMIEEQKQIDLFFGEDFFLQSL
jgi:group I intron endonuclease